MSTAQKEISERDIFKMHYSSYESSHEDGYFPPVGEDESVFGPNEMKYMEECIVYIKQKTVLPDTEEMKIIQVLLKKGFSKLPEAEQRVYDKFKSRIIGINMGVGYMFSDYVPVISLPDPEYDDDKYQEMMRHYFTGEQIIVISELIEIFNDKEKEDPDMSLYPFPIVVAIAHLFLVESIDDIKEVYSCADFGYIYADYLKEVTKSRYGLRGEYECEDDGYEYKEPGQYIVELDCIQFADMPPCYWMYKLEIMSYMNKFGIEVSSLGSLNFIEAFQEDQPYLSNDEFLYRYRMYEKYHDYMKRREELR
jgi:hypothetical protein